MLSSTIDIDRSAEALEALSPELRQSIHLTYYSGFTVTQVADLLGVTTTVVEERLLEGLRTLDASVATSATSTPKPRVRTRPARRGPRTR